MKMRKVDCKNGHNYIMPSIHYIMTTAMYNESVECLQKYIDTYPQCLLTGGKALKLC